MRRLSGRALAAINASGPNNAPVLTALMRVSYADFEAWKRRMECERAVWETQQSKTGVGNNDGRSEVTVAAE